jgi:hypothetical protein
MFQLGLHPQPQVKLGVLKAGSDLRLPTARMIPYSAEHSRRYRLRQSANHSKAPTDNFRNFAGLGIAKVVTWWSNITLQLESFLVGMVLSELGAWRNGRRYGLRKLSLRGEIR